MKNKANRMNSGIFVLILLTFCLTMLLSGDTFQNIQNRDMLKQMNRIKSLLPPATKQKTSKVARSFQYRAFSSDKEIDCYQAASEEVRRQFTNLSPEAVDILIFSVMFETLEAAEEDLRELQEEMYKMNETKEKLREYIKNLEKKMEALKPEKEEFDRSKKDKSLVKPQIQTPILKVPMKMAETRRLGLKYPKTPQLPDFKNPSDMTISALKPLLDDLKGNLDGMNEMSEITSLRLQMTMERHSKFISTLSNMMKKISTTQDTLVQNIK